MMISKKLRVLEIGKSTAGVGEYMRWLALGLDKSRFELTFACMSEGGEELATSLVKIEGLSAFSIPMNRYNISPISDFHALLRLAAEMRKGKFDLIHAHASKPGVLARLATIGSSIPVIYSPHCFAFHDGAHPLVACGIAFIERLLARFLTRKIITVADAEIELARRYRVGKEKQFTTIHSGINTEPFDAPLPAALLRQSMNIPMNVPLVGMVGRMSKQKNPFLFLRAAALIHNRHPQAHFILIGDGPLKQAAKSMAADFGIADSVHFPGFRNDIPNLLSEFTIFVLSSAWEAFPLTILEAMAARLPVVATDVMGVSEIVINQRTGLLVPADNDQAMAAAIKDLLDQPVLAKKYGIEGRKRVIEHFSRAEMINQITQAYYRTVA